MNIPPNELISIYNSRRTLIEVLSNKYDTANYANFNINEVEAMAKNNQLDMLLKNEDHSVYVKYMLSKSAIRLPAIDELVEDLYEIDNRGIYLVVHCIKRLQRNILKHTLVPNHSVVTDVAELKLEYNLKELSQLPEISRFDPIALLIELRPGQVCKIDRKSVTASESTYYRICV